MKKITNKGLTIITTILYSIIILTYELFYCNYELFHKTIVIYNFSIFRIISYIFFYIILYVFKDKFINVAIKTFDNKLKCKIIIGTLIASAITLYFILLNIWIAKDYNLFQIIGIISVILTNIFVIYISNDMIKNAIIICLTFGTIFSISIIINNQLDEKKHFLSEYSLAIGNFNWVKPTVDVSVAEIPVRTNLQDFSKYFRLKPQNILTKEYTSTDERNTPAAYYPISYISSATGIFLAKNLSR